MELISVTADVSKPDKSKCLKEQRANIELIFVTFDVSKLLRSMLSDPKSRKVFS